jgi:flagellar protein FlgJ
MAGAAYTDIGQLSRLRSGDAGALPKVAKQFESMFVDMMLKAARQATAVLSEGNPFESFETRLHGEMLDHQLAMDMSERGGIGLADVLVRQLGGTPAQLAPGGEGGAVDAPGARLAAAQLAARLRAVRAQGPAGDGSGSDGVATTAAPARGDKRRAFSDPVDFVRRVLPAVRRATAGTAVPPLAVLAQAALETGWGRAVIGDGQGGSSHNLFGIKSGGRWRGPSATVPTLEVRGGVAQRENAAFRVYQDIEHSVRDLMRTLGGSERYRDVVRADDAEGYADAIGRSGYATDPAYARKLREIMGGDTLRAALDVVLGEEAARARGAAAPVGGVPITRTPVPQPVK